MAGRAARWFSSDVVLVYVHSCCPRVITSSPDCTARPAADCAAADPSVAGNPDTTLFIARISYDVDEAQLQQLCSTYVTGASRGYAFVEFADEAAFLAAYAGLHGHVFHGRALLADWERERRMPGWKPRRLGGGLGGQKTSGQLRFGGRDLPFIVPHDALLRHGKRSRKRAAAGDDL